MSRQEDTDDKVRNNQANQNSGIFPECPQDESWRGLVARAQQGDGAAMERMVLDNMGLIHMVLKRFLGNYGSYDREELFQVGAVGLVAAIRRFDLSTGYSFSTYAVPVIIGEIRRFLRDDGMIHVGRRIKENAYTVARCKEQLLKENNTEPTIAQISDATGLSFEEIAMAIGASAGVDSIQRPLVTDRDGKEMTLEDQLVDESHTDEGIIDRVMLEKMMDKLPEKEQILVRCRYMDGRTQSETANLLGMTQVSVSRLEKKVLGKLRATLHGMG